MKNEMRVEFDAKSVNEGFARVTVAAFLTQLDPTLDEIADVKTAVSEAVTNAIIHGYENSEGKVGLTCVLEDDMAVITVEDKSDPYVSEMLSIGGFTVKNNLGGLVPYVIVRTNQKEVDALLGNISETAPSTPTSGMFWYKIDHTAKTVTLMKYNGTAWAAATEKQKLTYTWYKQDKDGKETAFGKTGKVIYLSADDIDSIATLQCDVSN